VKHTTEQRKKQTTEESRVQRWEQDWESEKVSSMEKSDRNKIGKGARRRHKQEGPVKICGAHNRIERPSDKISLPKESDGKNIGKGGRRRNG
jgi:hypothetical protein